MSVLTKIKELHIENTSLCNANCVMCPRGGMERYQGPMSDEIFNKCLNDLIPSPPVALHFHLNGEPMLLPIDKLVSRIKMAREALPNTGLIFFTNGSLMTHEATDKILSSDLDEICFSFDGGTKEDYEKIRRGLNFEKVRENIHYFQSMNLYLNGKTHPKKKRVKTHAFIVPQRDNRGSIDQFMRMFQQMKIDDVGGSGVQNIGGLIDSKEFRTDLQQVDMSLINSPCWRIFKDLDVMADGNIPVCCQCVQGIPVLGNAMERNLLEFWNGPEMNDIRIKFIQGKKNEIPFCKDCDYMPGHGATEWDWWPR